MTSASDAVVQAPWLDHAWQLFGVREKPGARDHADIMSMYRAVGHPGIAHDETPWCAAFLGACLERAGLKSTRSLMARSYAQWGQRLTSPRVGAVAVLTRGPDPALGHVGFWVGQGAGKIFLLGGNQSDSVTVAAFDKRRLIDLRWPDQDLVEDTFACTSTHHDDNEPSFEDCLPHILEMEGGYSNDPYDPGGPTNFGITLKVYATWRGAQLTAGSRDQLTRGLKKITQREVAAIYHKNYWQRAVCQKMPPGLALMHFDCAVNQGVSRATRFLQRAVATDVDGEIGPLTIAAARSHPVEETIEAYAALRRAHYRSLHHFWRFGRGWLRRVERTVTRARAHVRQHQLKISQCEKKETTMATKPATANKGKWWGHSTTIWGVVITTLSTVLPTLGPAIGVDVTPELVKDAGDQLVTTIQALSGLLGTIMTIYGRARAKTPLTQRAVNLRI